MDVLSEYYCKCFEWCRLNELPIDRIRIRVYEWGASSRLLRPRVTLLQFENGTWKDMGKVRAPHIRTTDWGKGVSLVYTEYIVDPIDIDLRRRLKARKRPGREEWVATIPG
jgi:hypothetical protein